MDKASKVSALLLAYIILISVFLIVSPALVDVTSDLWVELAPMPTVRSGLGMVVVYGKICALGGQVLVHQDQERTESKEVGVNEVYDPLTGEWESKTLMPIPASSFATAVYNGKIYCIGDRRCL